MLAVTLKNKPGFHGVIAFLECWHLQFKMLNLGDQIFLAVRLDDIHIEVYESFIQLLTPFEPIDLSDLLTFFKAAS